MRRVAGRAPNDSDPFAKVTRLSIVSLSLGDPQITAKVVKDRKLNWSRLCFAMESSIRSGRSTASPKRQRHVSDRSMRQTRGTVPEQLHDRQRGGPGTIRSVKPVLLVIGQVPQLLPAGATTQPSLLVPPYLGVSVMPRRSNRAAADWPDGANVQAMLAGLEPDLLDEEDGSIRRPVRAGAPDDPPHDGVAHSNLIRIARGILSRPIRARGCTCRAGPRP